MKFKRFSPLFLIACSLIAGCNNDDKVSLLSHSDYLLYGSSSTGHLFYQPTIDDFDNLYNSNLNYIILFSEKGCSACDNFDPIIRKYIENSHQLVVQIEGEDKYKIHNKYKDIFFPNDSIVTPSLFVKKKGNNFYKVNYSKYMGTYGSFSHHMSSRYKTSKSAYFCGEIPGETPIISNYTFVNFEANDAFKNLLSDKILSTEKNVIIQSNFNDNFMSTFEKNSDGEFIQIDTTKINDQLTDEIITKYL